MWTEHMQLFEAQARLGFGGLPQPLLNCVLGFGGLPQPLATVFLALVAWACPSSLMGGQDEGGVPLQKAVWLARPLLFRPHSYPPNRGSAFWVALAAWLAATFWLAGFARPRQELSVSELVSLNWTSKQSSCHCICAGWLIKYEYVHWFGWIVISKFAHSHFRLYPGFGGLPLPDWTMDSACV